MKLLYTYSRLNRKAVGETSYSRLKRVSHQRELMSARKNYPPSLLIVRECFRPQTVPEPSFGCLQCTVSDDVCVADTAIRKVQLLDNDHHIIEDGPACRFSASKRFTLRFF